VRKKNEGLNAKPSWATASEGVVCDSIKLLPFKYMDEYMRKKNRKTIVKSQ